MNVGPFDVKNLLIGGAIIAVTSIAMFLLRGPLTFGFVVPIWMFVIALVVVVVIVFVLMATILGYLRWGSEGFLFATARKNGTAIFIDAELGSDNADFALAEKSNPKDVVLVDEESGIKVDPSMLDSNCRPLRFKGGLDVYIYSYYNFMPQTIRNHSAFKAIEEYFKTECKELGFLSVKEFVELISDPEHYLERNALIKLNKYFKISEKLDSDGKVQYSDAENKIPLYTYVRRYEAFIDEYIDDNGVIVPGHYGLVEQDITLTGMVQLIARARQDVSVLPVMGGLIAGTEAFKNNSVAYSSQHLGHVLMLYYTKLIDEMKGKIEILTYGIVGLMLLCGTGVCIYLAGMVFKGSGS